MDGVYPTVARGVFSFFYIFFEDDSEGFEKINVMLFRIFLWVWNFSIKGMPDRSRWHFPPEVLDFATCYVPSPKGSD